MFRQPTTLLAQAIKSLTHAVNLSELILAETKEVETTQVVPSLVLFGKASWRYIQSGAWNMTSTDCPQIGMYGTGRTYTDSIVKAHRSVLGSLHGLKPSPDVKVPRQGDW